MPFVNLNVCVCNTKQNEKTSKKVLLSTETNNSRASIKYKLTRIGTSNYL